MADTPLGARAATRAGCSFSRRRTSSELPSMIAVKISCSIGGAYLTTWSSASTASRMVSATSTKNPRSILSAESVGLW